MSRALVVVVSTLLLAAVLVPQPAGADGAWLDGPVTNWNQPGMAIPPAPPRNSASQPQCFDSALQPDSPTRQALVDAGWVIFKATGATGSPMEILSGQANADGMCRPTDYQVFVFVSGVFAGTLSPLLMSSRTDGALVEMTVPAGDTIQATYLRYTPQDALCCPSARSTGTFKLNLSGTLPVIELQSVSTESASTASPTATATATPSAVGPSVTIQLDDDAIDPGESINVTVIAAYDAGIDWIQWEGVKRENENENENGNDNESSESDPELSLKEHDCNGTQNCANVWSVKPTVPGEYRMRARGKGEDGITSDWVTTVLHVRDTGATSRPATTSTSARAPSQQPGT